MTGKGRRASDLKKAQGLWIVPKGGNGDKAPGPTGFRSGPVDRSSRTGRLPRFPWLTRWQWALLGVMVLAVFTRFTGLGKMPLFHDEAYYWVWEQHIGAGNLELSFYDHPAGIAYLIYISTAMFGDSEFGVRAIFAILGVANIFLVYMLGRYLYDERTGVIAAFLLTVNFGHVLFSRSAMNDVAATFVFTVIMYLFAKAVFERSDRYLVMAGFALGVGFLIKYTIAVIALGFLMFVALYPKYRKFVFSKSLVYAIVIAAVLTTPFWVWNATHDWAGLVYQGGHASPFLGLFVGGDFFYNQVFSFFYYPLLWFVIIGVPLTVICLAGLGWAFKFHWRRESAAMAFLSFLGMAATYYMQLLILTFAFELIFWAAVYMAFKGFRSDRDALVGLTTIVFIGFFALSLGRMIHWVFPAFASLSILGARWIPRAYSSVAINRRQATTFVVVAMFGLNWMGAYAVNSAWAMSNSGDAPDPKSIMAPGWVPTTYGTKELGIETAEVLEMYPGSVVLVPNWVTYSPVSYYLYREGVDAEIYTWVWDYQIGIVWERDIDNMPPEVDRAVIPVYESSFLGEAEEGTIIMFLAYSSMNGDGWKWWGSNDQTLYARTGFDHFEVISVGEFEYNYTFFWTDTRDVNKPYFIAYGEKRGGDNVTVIHAGYRYSAPKSALTYEGAQGTDWLYVFDCEPVMDEGA